MDNLILVKNHQASSMLEQANEEFFETIKLFIEYARTQGSWNADKYSARITEAINRALFTYEGRRPSNIINLLNSKQQKHVLVAEDIFIYNLEAGMAKNLDHRDIYFHACFEVIGFAEIIGKSIVPSKDITESIISNLDKTTKPAPAPAKTEQEENITISGDTEHHQTANGIEITTVFCSSLTVEHKPDGNTILTICHHFEKSGGADIVLNDADRKHLISLLEMS